MGAWARVVQGAGGKEGSQTSYIDMDRMNLVVHKIDACGMVEGGSYNPQAPVST